MRCSHCGTEVEDTGEVVTCPRCTRPIFPRAVAVRGDLMPPAPHSSPIIVIGSHAPQRRLEAGGWFARAFSTTSGVLVAVFLFLIVVGIVLPVIFILLVAAIGQFPASR